MLKMKKQEGMTYPMLILVLLLIVILIALGVMVLVNHLTDQKQETVRTNMLLTQAKIKVMKESSVAKKDESLLKGKKVSENLEEEKVKQMLEKQVISQEEEHFDRYYILDQAMLEEMGLTGILFKEGNYYIVNYDTFEIIWTQGIKIKGKTFYKLSELEKEEPVDTNTQETNVTVENIQ